MKKILTLLLALSAASAFAAAPSPAAAGLRAGAATSNITPALGTAIVGGFAPYPAEHVHDELHARCLVLDDGKTKIALVVCDVLGMHRSVSVEARRLIRESTGIPPENVLISATHTHSAGSVVGENRFLSDQTLDENQRFTARRIADGVRRAANLLRPAEIAFGTVDIPEHVNNRRWHMREGSKALLNPFGKMDKVKTNGPSGSPEMIEPAGPTDPTVSFIALREPNGRLIAVYSAYSLHYIGGVGGRHISADYYGAYCEALKALQPASREAPFVAIMANGTSGDVNNSDFRSPRPRKPPYQHLQDVGNDVAAKVNAAIGGVTWRPTAELGARYREAAIAWRPVDAELLAWAKDVEAKAPRLPKGDIPVAAKHATTPDWVQKLSYAGRVQLLHQAGAQPAKAPLQLLRIGDIGIGSIPCETFVEIGLEFKKRSPFAHSFMVSIAHGYFGYLPTPRHFALGGYETWPGTNYFEPQASVKMLDQLMEMAADAKRGAR
jgi:neutral ceramidase